MNRCVRCGINVVAISSPTPSTSTPSGFRNAAVIRHSDPAQDGTPSAFRHVIRRNHVSRGEGPPRLPGPDHPITITPGGPRRRTDLAGDDYDSRGEALSLSGGSIRASITFRAKDVNMALLRTGARHLVPLQRVMRRITASMSRRRRTSRCGAMGRCQPSKRSRMPGFLSGPRSVASLKFCRTAEDKGCASRFFICEIMPDRRALTQGRDGHHAGDKSFARRRQRHARSALRLRRPKPPAHLG